MRCNMWDPHKWWGHLLMLERMLLTEDSLWQGFLGSLNTTSSRSLESIETGIMIYLLTEVTSLADQPTGQGATHSSVWEVDTLLQPELIADQLPKEQVEELLLITITGTLLSLESRTTASMICQTITARTCQAQEGKGHLQKRRQSWVKSKSSSTGCQLRQLLSSLTTSIENQLRDPTLSRIDLAVEDLTCPHKVKCPMEAIISDVIMCA